MQYFFRTAKQLHIWFLKISVQTLNSHTRNFYSFPPSISRRHPVTNFCPLSLSFPIAALIFHRRLAMGKQSDHTRSQPHVPQQPTPSHYVAVENFLKTSHDARQLGNSKPDGPAPSLVGTIITTFPWFTILIQALWSSAVMIAAYYLARDVKDRTRDTLDKEFWTTDLSVASSLLSGVGWALFVLLGFYIREASRRYMSAAFSWNVMCTHLAIALRHIIQIHSTCFWHPGDLDRIVAHLIACPIVVKMALRGERDPSQLQPILDPADLDDVMSAESMHAHCLRVVRSYLISKEPGAEFGFQPQDRGRFGPGISYISFDFIDTVNYQANTALNIAQFSPAPGYVTHLNVFMIIWLFFLPLNLIAVSGWYVFCFLFNFLFLLFTHFSIIQCRSCGPRTVNTQLCCNLHSSATYRLSNHQVGTECHIPVRLPPPRLHAIPFLYFSQPWCRSLYLLTNYLLTSSQVYTIVLLYHHIWCVHAFLHRRSAR